MLLYGRDHPYGRPFQGTRASVASITWADVVAFYRRIMVPGNAALVVVGDVRPDAIATALEARLGDWPSGPLPSPTSIEPIPTPPARRRIDLIDWPGASQSYLIAGRIGAARNSPDYHALIVLNTILGGQFSSRINQNLRHRKGYSYSFGSDFTFYRGAGSFQLSGLVETGVTREAMAELFKELGGIVGDHPVTEDELAFARERLILGFPARFETTFQVAHEVGVQFAYDMPDDAFERYQPRLEALTTADIDRIARKYITPDRMTVLIVGDRERIEGPLRQLAWTKDIWHLDVDGHSRDDPFENLREKVPPVKLPDIGEDPFGDPFDPGP